MSSAPFLAREATLYFEAVQAASRRNVFCSDDTYYASVELELRSHAT